MAMITKTVECPKCQQDINFMVEIYADDGDLCWYAPDAVQCQMCGEEVDISIEIEVKVEAHL